MKLIKYFERKAKGKIVQELEGLRFLAILPVVIQHCVERWEKNAYTPGASPVADFFMNYFLGGSAGVYLFFAISGFILPLPFAIRRLDGRPMGSLKTYFMRRLTRLEPPYILIMLLMAISALVLHKMSTGQTLGYFFSGITYSSTLIYHQFNKLNPVIWSLEVEIQFYILAPFITYFVFGIKSFAKRNMVIIAGILLLILMQELTGISYGLNYMRYTILGQLQYFMVGIFMVNLYLQHKLQPRGYTWLWDIAATAAIISMVGFRWVSGFGRTVLFVAILATLFAGAFRSGAFNRFMKRPWIMAIGGMCYSIYLLHLAVAQACMELILKMHPGLSNNMAWFIAYLALFTVCLLLTVPIFYLLVEKPCMDHSWPTQLRQFIRSKFNRRLNLEKTATDKM